MTTMPAEWAPHERTWMAFPPSGPSTEDLDAEGLAAMRAAWVAVAHAVLRFEPVTMVGSPIDSGRRAGFAPKTPAS